MTLDMTHIRSEERLKILRDLALIDGPQETFYDRMTILAKAALNVEAALVSMVAREFQFFKSCVGIPPKYAKERHTHISGSFCKHVVATNEPLVVIDARTDPRVADHSAIQELGMISYLGMPLTLYDGKRLGSFCVYNSHPYTWNDTEIAIARELAQLVTYEIDLKAMAALDPAYQQQLDAAYNDLFALIASVDPDTPQVQFLERLRAARERFNV
ncbi:MAG: GAF domain-containing protein [Chloroflexi bacterium]|nr:GAF domain-containing protein [Chloroflexota bacterium]